MPNLKDLKLQINSVGSTKKITSAMKMVAASKLRRSQERAEAARPYSSSLEEMLSSIATSNISADGVVKLLTGNGKKNRFLLVPITADRGLCGGFNNNINRDTSKYIKQLENEGKSVNLITIGKKSRDFFNRLMKDKIIENYADLGTTGANYNIAMEISNKIQELFFEDKFDVCTIVYNKFVSVLNQEVTRQQIIPLQINVLKKEQNSSTDEKNDNSIYNYEPDEAAILKDLLPKNISIQIFKVLLESNAGEQGARMAAMDNATRNAGEMIDNLTLKYNRTRQAFITKELIEIISGAESV